MQKVKHEERKTSSLARPIRTREAVLSHSLGTRVWAFSKAGGKVAFRGLTAVLNAFKTDDDWWRFSPMQW